MEMNSEAAAAKRCRQPHAKDDAGKAHVTSPSRERSMILQEQNIKTNVINVKDTTGSKQLHKLNCPYYAFEIKPMKLKQTCMPGPSA